MRADPLVNENPPERVIRREQPERVMAKELPRETRLMDLTDEEVARIEADAFCCGGPPSCLSESTARRATRACESTTPSRRG